MGENSAIGWTDHTFNPWTGCTKVSEACRNCYAESWAKRTGIVKWGDSAERRRTSPANWKQPLKWNREAMVAGVRKRVFCASLADVFENRPELVIWRRDLFHLIYATPYLDWLLLTKRPEHAARLISEVWPKGFPGVRNRIAIGTTVESQSEARRIDYLVNLRPFARVLFLSVEPMLGPLDLYDWLSAVDETRGFNYNRGIDWVIAGGESGPNHRPLNIDHVRALRDQCVEYGVPFFFKQHGGRTPEANGCLLDGREWKEFPKPSAIAA